mgnify:CR=1 FL=1
MRHPLHHQPGLAAASVEPQFLQAARGVVAQVDVIAERGLARGGIAELVGMQRAVIG